jgi:alkanesulfonate monooxygenase SsuD/methylene tetrahydromethanopterin reductase-like flavin-dependent oxidoreductase (luciferase family)
VIRNRELHVGVTPWAYDAETSAARLAEQAEFAEALGFRSFWLPESHFTGRSANPAPLLLLAAVAARTRRLAIATTSFLLPVRHPLHVAAEVAVLDRLSGGRVILGVGRGFRRALFDAFDVPVAEKRDRFEAALGVMRDAWQGRPVVPGNGEAASPVTLSPRPLQSPHPPVWVAAFGPKALAQAGRLGLPYLASPMESMGQLEANYAAHRETLTSSHGDAALAVPIMRTVFAHRDPELLRRVRDGLAREAAALARAPSQAIRRAGDASLDDRVLVGEPEEVACGIERYREKLGMTHLVVRSPVPAAREEEVVESLQHLAALYCAPDP